MLPGLCAHWFLGISFNSLSFTLSDLGQLTAPPRSSLSGPLYVLCSPRLFHEPYEAWNYGCFLVLAPELSNVWHIEITQVFMKWMNGLTSHWNDYLSDKFNWRSVEMMWTHINHIMAFLPLYHESKSREHLPQRRRQGLGMEKEHIDETTVEPWTTRVWVYIYRFFSIKNPLSEGFTSTGSTTVSQSRIPNPIGNSVFNL